MQLWTYHEPRFSLTSGSVDHSLSTYYCTVEGVPEAYRRLWARLDNNTQIVWCYTVPNQYSPTGIGRVEWLLDISDEAITAFVDDIVWNRILGVRCGLPTALRSKWKDEAIAAHPEDAAGRKVHVEKQTEKFWSLEAPDGDWWKVLFVAQQARECVSALIDHPIDTACVTRKEMKVARPW